MRVTSRLAGRSLRKPAATHPLLNRMGSSRPYVLFSSWVQRLMTPYQTSDLPSDMNGSGDTCHELWPDISWTPRPSDEDAMNSFSWLWPEIAWTPRASTGIEAQDIFCSGNEANTTTQTEDAGEFWTDIHGDVTAPLDTDSDAASVCLWPSIAWTPRSSDSHGKAQFDTDGIRRSPSLQLEMSEGCGKFRNRRVKDPRDRESSR